MGPLSLRRSLGLLALGAAVSCLPQALHAQATLRTGSQVQGELKAGDLKLDDDTYADLWRFSGRRGQGVRITMRAPAFDAYLQLGYYNDGGDWVHVASDDDGAGGTDPQIAVTLPRDGDFVVRANTLMVGKTGSYSLLLEDAAAAPAAPAAGGSPLVSGTPGAHMPLVLGEWLVGTLGPGDDTLSDGSFGDIWVYQGHRGETLTMIQKSDAVDSYLTFGPVQNGRWIWDQADNNGAGGKDSRLVVTLASDGEYWVRPNALFSGRGAYSLLVTSSGASTRVAAPVAAPEASVAPTPIQLGQTIRGRLAAGDPLSFDTTYIDTYVYRGKRGERINIIMMSPDFGSYLLFGREPDGAARFSSMEHEGAVAGREATISVTVPEDGDFWIQANQFDRTDGAYVLTLEAAR